MSIRNERDAHAALSQTAKLRRLDLAHGEINRERRKPSTAGQRAPETLRPSEVRGERDQLAIEDGTWPKYTP
jgi:hypothetical protein